MAVAKAEQAIEPKLDVAQAANAAARYFKTLYPNVQKFSLEEVDRTEDEKFWLITLSFEVKNGGGKNLVSPFAPPATKYKVFKVDVETGRVMSMKIRTVES
jgi:hypothetical protein